MRNDPVRLAELRRLLILDSSPERVFDDITRMLADQLGAPIAMVNLLDADRDWFKSCIGMAQSESPASTSFCEAFFHGSDELIVSGDTAADPRFEKHPLVVGEPHVRFYAAARLAVGGHTLGTLCAYDVKPRDVSAEQIEQLRVLATAAVEALRARTPP